MVSEPAVSWGSVAWANEQLRFTIAVLQGRVVVSTWPGRLQIALQIKDRLASRGYSWQVKVIEYWIHRLQPRRADSPRGEGERAH